MHPTGNEFEQGFVSFEPASLFLCLFFVACFPFPQLVLLRNKKKVFTLDSLGYEPEFAVIHPGGTTVAVGGNVGGQTNSSHNKMSYFHRNQSSFLFSFRMM